MLDPVGSSTAVRPSLTPLRASPPISATDRPVPSRRLPPDTVEFSEAARRASRAYETRVSEAPLATASSGKSNASDPEALTPQEERQVDEFERGDREVRQHERAHKAAGGQYAGAISYTFTTGPDGKRYATSGHVPIDTAPIEGDPRGTQQKMQQVIRAANAPANPSGADRQVAAKAARELRQAQAEISRTGSRESAADSAAAAPAVGSKLDRFA